MKTLKNYLHYRFFRVILPCLILAVLYLFSMLVNIHETTLERDVRYGLKITYNEYIHLDQRMLLLGFLMILIMGVMLFVMFRDMQVHKERLMILPQSPHVFWVLDAGLFACFWILLAGIQFVTYRVGFSQYVDIIKSFSDFPYWQTNNIITSLYENTLCALWYPTTLSTIIKSGLIVFNISLTLPYLYTNLALENVSKTTLFRNGVIWCLAMYGMIESPFVWLSYGCAIALSLWMLKVLMDCYSRNRMGGK